VWLLWGRVLNIKQILDDNEAKEVVCGLGYQFSLFLHQTMVILKWDRDTQWGKPSLPAPEFVIETFH
jgi:hypothetical protein